MKLPGEIHKKIIDEARKNASFKWYSGWNNSSGYISSNLTSDRRYFDTRIYIKWEKKKAPTEDQITEEINKHIESLLNNKLHSTTQRDFKNYILNTYYIDIYRLQNEVKSSIEDCLDMLIKIIEKSDEFTEPRILDLHNDLKNLYAAIEDQAAITEFLEYKRDKK